MFHRLILPVAAFALAIAVAPTSRADDGEKLDRWFELARMEETMRGFPEAVMDGIGKGSDWGGPVGRPEVEALARKHFAAKVLVADLRRMMTGKLTDALLVREIVFLETDLGRRIVAMEAAASDPALDDVIEREGARIYRELVEADSPRVDLIRRAIDGTGLIDWGMATGMNLGYAMLTALAGDQMAEDQILTLINANMGGMRQELRKIGNGSVAYTYRSLTDEDLERYVREYESPEGQVVLKAFLEAYRVVLVERSRAFGYELRDLVRQRKS